LQSFEPEEKSEKILSIFWREKIPNFYQRENGKRKNSKIQFFLVRKDFGKTCKIEKNGFTEQVHYLKEDFNDSFIHCWFFCFFFM